jgi:phosphoglycerate dehydrogenase-like enzyme
VVLVVPLTRQTAGMAGADFLARMPDGAVLDVTDPEPPPDNHPL